MKDKSHKGQRHKGCGLCTPEKRAGNGGERRPASDRRRMEGAAADLRHAHVKG
jgi:hypothetical protein